MCIYVYVCIYNREIYKRVYIDGAVRKLGALKGVHQNSARVDRCEARGLSVASAPLYGSRTNTI